MGENNFLIKKKSYSDIIYNFNNFHKYLSTKLVPHNYYYDVLY